MSVSRWVTVAVDMLLVIFTVYLFFLYFGIFFRRNANKIRLLIGIIALVLWQFSIPGYCPYTGADLECDCWRNFYVIGSGKYI